MKSSSRSKTSFLSICFNKDKKHTNCNKHSVNSFILPMELVIFMDESIFMKIFKAKAISVLFTLASVTPYSHAEESSVITPYIINGNATSTFTHPYMGILIINRLSESSNSVEYFCGGTLLNEQYVLTAAHCLYTNNPSEFKNLEVVFNVDNIKDDIFSRTNAYAAAEIYYPNAFKPDDNFQNDIAVIKLATPVSESVVSSRDFVNLALDENYRVENQPFSVIGYGKTGPDEDSSDTLQTVQVKYAQPEQCDGIFAGDSISDKQICVTGEVVNNLRSGVCGGDSGGPLLYENNGRLYQAGIVSFGPKQCGDSNVSIQSVYTETYNYSDWLAGVLNGTTKPQYDITSLDDQDKPTKVSSSNSSSGGSLGWGWEGLLMLLVMSRMTLGSMNKKRQ